MTTRTSLSVAIALVCALALSARAQFATGTSYPVGPNPDGVALADFNGDGLVDIAATADLPDRVVFLTNAGSGTFVNAGFVLVGGGTGAQALAAADVDLDGDIDLVLTLKNTSAVTILSNTGGIFTPGPTTTVGQEPRSVAVGDLNGNGLPDIVTSNRNSDSVSVLMNAGGGSFPSATNVAVGLEPRAVTLGDFDGNGTADIAVSNHDSRSITVLNGITFATLTTLTIAAPFRPEGLTSADFDGNGTADLATSAEGAGVNTVMVFLNAGGASFGAPGQFVVGGIDPGDVVAADFSGDGLADLATANNTSNDVSVLTNLGAGTFGAPALLTAGSEPERVVAADLDGNGSQDLVASNKLTNDVTVFLNGGGGPGGPTYAGSNDDYSMRTGLGAAGITTAQDVKTAVTGDILTVSYDSTFGTFDYLPVAVLAQVFATGGTPPNAAAVGFPEVHVDPMRAPAPVVLVDGTRPSGFGFLEVLLPGGNAHAYFLPAGLNGLSIMLQAFVPTGIANNGFFAATDAHEIQVL